MREESLPDRVFRRAVTEQGRDGITGFNWCRARLDGISAWSAGREAETALKQALRQLTGGLRCASVMPASGFLGLGWGDTKADALAAAWQDLFLCAIRVKLKRDQLTPPDAEELDAALWAEINARYRAAGKTAALKDCGMLKGYPVLALRVDDVLTPGTGTTWRDAVIDCVSRDVRRRLFGEPPGIRANRDEAPSYPAAVRFHGDAADAVGDYLAMARRYDAVVRARDLSLGDLSIFRIFTEKPDPEWYMENASNWQPD